ncbi:MAG: FeoB-associated Cys-rich membrane protein [Erysipelotrichaceae bacterium]|nr:FeoB-associated Cys-rich membrane protein [Erysipelotrichaceae bacterium]MDY5252992.1 FeoB-associated Cys-rich membrane protein [Erysipelotrichaceae bacterium]
MSTAIVTVIIVITVYAAVRKMVKDKKQGRSCCQSGCHNCSKCH